MPPSRNNKSNTQDRRNRRDDPLRRGPERTASNSTQRQAEGLSLGRPVTEQQGHSSTQRGRRSGQRGRGGYSSMGGRGRSSMTWNQSQPEPETAYEYSTTAWMTRVCAADGVFATKLSPSGLGGGFGNNWYTGTADKGYWIHSETGAGVEKLTKRLKEDLPAAVGFNITISPIIPGKLEAVERDHTEKIVMNNEFRDKDNKPVGLFGRVIQAPSEKKPVAKGDCESCGSDKHVLSDCVERGWKGFVSGCTICNSRSHSVDSCDHFKAMSLLEKVQALVQERANRPPVNTSTPWWRYLHEFCTREEFIPGVVVGFPWSEQLCEAKGWKAMKKIQAEFDANPEGYAFDVDEKTASFGKVYETYWQPNDMAWPAIFGPRIKPEVADGPIIKAEPEA